jgi:membrane associated rhomboid family serine protease
MSIVEDIKNVFRKDNNTLVQLIVINILVFLALILVNAMAQFSPAGINFNANLTKNIVLNVPIQHFIYRPWTLLTYSFTHFSFWHILSNMLFLFWFGSLIKEYLGSRKLLNIYLLGGIFGGLFYMIFYNILVQLPVQNILGENLIGASGAVYAIMFATVALLPEYEFYFFGVFLIKIRYLAWFFLIISFITPGTGIAHVGGAIFGYTYITLLRKGIDIGSPLEGVADWWRNIRKPKPKMKITHRQYSETTIASKGNNNNISIDPNYFPDQDEVDAILDKIGKSGYESLTREEKQKLYRASQKKD